jgi:hypothetical protein
MGHISFWSMLTGDNVNIIKKNTDALANASKVVCLKVNRGNLIYVDVSPPECKTKS